MDKQIPSAETNIAPGSEIEKELETFTDTPISAAKIGDIISTLAAIRFLDAMDDPLSEAKEPPSDIVEVYKELAEEDHILFGITELERVGRQGQLDELYISPRAFIEGTTAFLSQFVDEKYGDKDENHELALAGVAEANQEMLQIMYGVYVEQNPGQYNKD